MGAEKDGVPICLWTGIREWRQCPIQSSSETRYHIRSFCFFPQVVPQVVIQRDCVAFHLGDRNVTLKKALVDGRVAVM